MPYPEKFEGFTVHNPKTWDTFHKEEVVLHINYMNSQLSE